MQIRILLCALVALTAYATPIVAPNPKSVKLMSKNDNEENLKDNFEVIRFKRAASDSEETDVSRLDDLKSLMIMVEKLFSNSETLSKARGMSGRMPDMIKFIMQFLQLIDNFMNTNNINSIDE